MHFYSFLKCLSFTDASFRNSGLLPPLPSSGTSLLIIKCIKHAVNASKTIGGNSEFLVLTFNVRLVLFTHTLCLFTLFPPTKSGKAGAKARSHVHIESTLQ